MFVVERRVRDERCHKKLEGLIESTIDEVKSIDDVGDWVERMRGISRKQSLSDEWTTDYYELCLACGGPALWLRTDGTIIAAWWGDHLKVKVEDEEFLEKLSEIEAYLDEVFSKPPYIPRL